MISVLHDTKMSIQVYKSADNESLTGAGVDTLGYRGVAFVVGAAGGEDFATWAIKAQQDSASGFGTAADLVGSSKTFSTVASPSTDGLAVLEITEPRERYVRPVITVPNVSTAKITFCVAILFGAKNLPVGANVGELHVNPAEGTA